PASRDITSRRMSALGREGLASQRGLGGYEPRRDRPLLTGRAMRLAQTSPLTALVAQALLIAALAAMVGLSGVGLSPAAWVVGLTCVVITDASLARGLSRYRVDRLAPAASVTL